MVYKNSDTEFEKAAVEVSLVSIIGNTVLSLFKAFAGIVAGSGAMISDALHSASDVISSVIVIIGVKFSAKASDKAHPYGHERFECVAAIILSAILMMSGLIIGLCATDTIVSGKYSLISPPGKIALVAAIISITSKEAMYHYTKHYAVKYSSGALMADAWHHRSDALSSVGSLIGIAGARLGFPAADPVASVVICIFIIKAAVDIFNDAINKMVDCSCDTVLEEKIISCAEATDGVKGIDLIRTRIFGNKIYVDLEIRAEGSISLAEGHKIAENVHNSIEENFKDVKHIMVHVNPEN